MMLSTVTGREKSIGVPNVSASKTPLHAAMRGGESCFTIEFGNRPLKPAPAGLRRRFDSEQCAVFFLRQQVEKSVWALPHIPDALVQFRKQRFAAQLFHFFVEYDAFKPARRRNFPVPHAADKNVSFP